MVKEAMFYLVAAENTKMESTMVNEVQMML